MKGLRAGSGMIDDNIQKARADNVVSNKYGFGAYLYDPVLHFFLLFVGGAPEWRSSFIKLINPLPGEKIAELCCGTGAVSLKISKLIDGRVWACDMAPDQIRVAAFKSKLLGADVEFSVQEASGTSYPTAFFDRVIISGALHEIKRGRRIAIYDEARRLLKTDGLFCVSEPVLPEKGWGRFCFKVFFGRWNPEHDTACELTGNGLENELYEAGFQKNKSRESNFRMFRSSVFRKARE